MENLINDSSVALTLLNESRKRSRKETREQKRCEHPDELRSLLFRCLSISLSITPQHTVLLWCSNVTMLCIPLKPRPCAYPPLSNKETRNFVHGAMNMLPIKRRCERQFHSPPHSFLIRWKQPGCCIRCSPCSRQLLGSHL